MSFTIRTHKEGKDLLTTEFIDVARAAANGLARWHRNMGSGTVYVYENSEYYGAVIYEEKPLYTWVGGVT